jgi:hypothetical protein
VKPFKELMKGSAVMRWYGVAIWFEERSLFPERFGYVESSSAFEALEFLMELAGRTYAAHVAAVALDRSFCYRDDGVDLG